MGPKRPPMAGGVRADGTGVVVVVRTPGIVDVLAAYGVEVIEVDVPGPPTGLLRAPWMEVAMLTGVPMPGATATISDDGAHVSVRVECGEVLDEVVLRSYCIGATHMALGWVRSEGIAIDDAGEVHDLTIRSFGIVRPNEMPHVDVEIVASDGPPVNGSDAVFAAVAAAEWARLGHPQDLPVARGLPKANERRSEA
jgi:hypothetical protein